MSRPYTYSICYFTNLTLQSKSYLAHCLGMSERSGAMQNLYTLHLKTKMGYRIVDGWANLFRQFGSFDMIITFHFETIDTQYIKISFSYNLRTCFVNTHFNGFKRNYVN